MSESTAAAGERPPPLWLRHDVLVVAVAALLLAFGAWLYRSLTAPAMTPFAREGLRFERPSNLLPPRAVEVPSSALSTLHLPEVEGGAGAVGAAQRPPGLPFHEVFQATDDPRARLEVLIDVRPEYRGLPMWLRLARHTRYGEFYWADSTLPRDVGGHTWQRTRFKYAFKATADDAPQVATGIEYATLNGKLLYVVTMHGSGSGAARLESLIAPTLAVTDRPGTPAQEE